MSFSAGQMPNALGIIVACHLEKCMHCKKRAAFYDRLGGEILMTTEDATVSSSLLEQTLLMLDSKNDATETLKSERIKQDLPVIQGLPRPLRRFVPADYAKLPWSGMTSSLKEFVLPFSGDGYTAKFYKISAGKELPVHTHRGNEYTLVLDGSFSDTAGDYHQGDFVLADTQTIHQPKAANDGDCICFAVTDAPLKMTGFFGRMLNPFMK